ncbi:hypothetical protein JTE90_012739 [Oedothorax gibbosus]|uniref:Extracellular superoxide dismutase [Cu-Zn] n=1 Tax=Oedothorax gibbosus TaxID=931172 RepID=A0AAV6VZY7_9ARAC|nr:hypothetical protein JTE90_012739 [Oedothorax gibbosus]
MQNSESESSTVSSKVEFDVNLTCQKCASKVEDALSSISGVSTINIDVEKQSVIVQTSLPSQVIKEAIQSTGKRAVLKGIGSASAVAELKHSSGLLGVIRFHQTEKECIIDGTIDGLTPGKHGLHIHEYGDLSDGDESIGPHFNPDNSAHGGQQDCKRHYGDLGNINADSSGRASFRILDKIVQVPDIIGRSVAVTENRDDLGQTNTGTSSTDGNSGKSLASAIIARSAGLFQNPKRLCQCDGTSIWDETKQPSSSFFKKRYYYFVYKHTVAAAIITVSYIDTPTLTRSLTPNDFGQSWNMAPTTLATLKRPFQCTHCGKGFTQKANLQRHMLIHTGHFPFQCTICTKGFRQKVNLLQHMRTHGYFKGP